MKKISTSLLLAALVGAGGLGSCSKLTKGFDQNPNTATDAPATLQLTAAELGEGFVMSGELARTANIWAGVFHGADRQYQAIQNYITSTQDYDNAWTNSYQVTLAQLRVVEDKANAVGNKQLLGVTQVVEAQMIGTVTALWGDVPYSKAFVPDTPPAYDAQKDVYAAIQTLLTTAIGNLTATTGAGASITADIFYGGDQNKWVAAAHSLKARYYLHVKNYAQAAAEAKLGIASPAGNLLMPYTGVVGVSANPYWDFINSRTNYIDGVGSYAPKLLQARTNSKTNETARYNYFYTSSKKAYSALDPNWIDGAFQADKNFPLMTYTETQAILAESLQRTGDNNGALTALNAIRTLNSDTIKSSYAANGIPQDPTHITRKLISYMSYVLSDFTPGGVANPTSAGLAQSNALLKEILVEKYLALIGQIEEFNDVRRTNNLIGVPLNTSTATTLPQRLLYPQVELNTNPNIPNPLPGLFAKTPVNN